MSLFYITSRSPPYTRHNVLHWLPFRHWIIFRLAALVWRCLLGIARAYLQDLCSHTLGARGHSSLRSTERGILCPFCPYFNSSGSSILRGRPLCLEWASISPLALRLLPRVHYYTFYSNLKTAPFSHAIAGSASKK